MDACYITDVPYTFNFIDKQSPVSLNYIAKLRGLKPALLHEPFHYCELGCGHGITINLLAAAHPQAQFYAIDINPEHIAHAKQMALQAKLTNVTFILGTFAELQKYAHLTFDYITSHGVYSWVPDAARAQIRDIAAKMLKPNGLFYISYSTLPGWGPMLTLRQLMLDYIKNIPTKSTLEKAKEAFLYLKHLRDNHADYFEETPNAQKILDTLSENDVHYIVHEFLNDICEPFYFFEVADQFRSIGLHYAGSASLIHNFSHLMLNKKLIPILNDCKDIDAKEARQSLMTNECVRYDIYSSQVGTPPQINNFSAFAEDVVGSLYDLALFENYFTVKNRRFELNGPIYETLPSLLTGQKSLKEIAQDEALKQYSPEELTKAVHGVIVAGEFQVFAKKENVSCENLNFKLKHPLNCVILETLLFLNDPVILMSPVLGGGFKLKSSLGLMLLACDDVGNHDMDVYMLEYMNKKQPALCAEFKENLPMEKEWFFYSIVPQLYRLDIIIEK